MPFQATLVRVRLSALATAFMSNVAVSHPSPGYCRVEASAQKLVLRTDFDQQLIEEEVRHCWPLDRAGSVDKRACVEESNLVRKSEGLVRIVGRLTERVGRRESDVCSPSRNHSRVDAVNCNELQIAQCLLLECHALVLSPLSSNS
jgi:hypothetical protein